MVDKSVACISECRFYSEMDDVPTIMTDEGCDGGIMDVYPRTGGR